MPTPIAAKSRFHEGRDELNLADFPVSVLQRQQPLDEQGAKVDTAVYSASRYDPALRRRVQQRVTLETSSRLGLPTPADENVILALLYVAKHTHNFEDPFVPFAPRQLFQIMGWAPNSRSYVRLRAVLRRLKALVIRYENSWWDIAGRAYEAEVATGIISEYELGRQVRGRKAGAQAPACWVCWSPHFQESLRNGNLKKLDLDTLFGLRLPTSQRMYRFLDKRFYPPHQPPGVEMDLHDFAFGHVGLSRVENVAEIKRRLAPAIAELEGIGFIAPADARQRYHKVRPGVWRVRFDPGPRFGASKPAPLPRREAAAAPATRPPPDLFPEETDEEWQVVTHFYERWDRGPSTRPGPKDLGQARELVRRHGLAKVEGVLPHLVQVVRRKWPECKSFSGAVGKYLDEALQVYEHARAEEEKKQQARLEQQRQREEHARREAEWQELERRWQALGDGPRAAVEQAALERYPEHRDHPGILHRLCLQELGRLPYDAPAGIPGESSRRAP